MVSKKNGQKFEAAAGETSQIHVVQEFHNILSALESGERVPAVPRKIPSVGRMSQLWSPLIQNNQNLASKGTTGADCGAYLCEKGYLEYWFEGKKIEAGTPTSEQPHRKILREVNPNYQLLKPLTREIFYSLLPKEYNAARFTKASND